jgi:hypothetical protein
VEVGTEVAEFPSDAAAESVEYAPGERILVELPTYAETSPSGTGIKAFFYVASEYVRPFLELIGVTDPTKWGGKRSVSLPSPNGSGSNMFASTRRETSPRRS